MLLFLLLVFIWSGALGDEVDRDATLVNLTPSFYYSLTNDEALGYVGEDAMWFADRFGSYAFVAGKRKRRAQSAAASLKSRLIHKSSALKREPLPSAFITPKEKRGRTRDQGGKGIKLFIINVFFFF